MSVFARELRRLRVRAELSQKDLAGRLGVKREIVSQWETAKFLPGAERVAAADEALGAGGELIRTARRERGSLGRALVGRPASAAAGPGPPDPDDPGDPGGRDEDEPARGRSGVDGDPSRIDLATVFERVGATLRDGIIDGTGWAHTVGEGTRPTPWSTALGLRTLQLIDGHRGLDLTPPLRLIAGRQEPDGGWANRAREISRPEPTAIVLDALSRVGGGGADLERGWRWLETAMPERDRERPYVVSTVLGCVAEARPHSPLLASLTDALLELARPDGMWSSNPTATIAADASVAHTARAVAALRAVARRVDRPEVRQAITDGLGGIAAWEHEFSGVTEVMRIDPDDRGQDVPVDHFTAAHVLIALVGTHVPVPATVWDTFWGSYHPGQGIWVWKHDGRTPMWMTLDAVRALRRWSLVHRTVPSAPPAPSAPGGSP